MSRKWVIRVVAILMALIMAISVLYVVIDSITARAVTTQSQINSLKEQQKEYEKKKAELKAQIDALKSQQATALQQKELLDNQIALTQEQIENISEQIDTYDELITQKTAELENAQLTEDAYWERYKATIRTMEENGSVSYISVVLQANSFADMLSRISDVGEIMRYQQDTYERLKASKQATLDAKTDLETAKAGQEEVKAELEKRNIDLAAQVDEAKVLLEELEEDLSVVQELYEKEKKDAAAIQAEINKKVAELQKQQVKGTGSFVWPVPSCNIVTSKFGRRYHPIYKEYRMHYGVDIGGGYGVNVIAADGGTVITSKYSSSYGNYIVISHGNGKTTLYAHLSSRLVKEGATVKQSQVVGKLGSTGASTGPHLHFEVSVNGSRVDPLKYYNNYTLQ